MERYGFAGGVVVFGLEMRGLCRWAGVSGEDGFVCRMERIWRLGTAGFGTPESQGPYRGSRCLLSGAKRKSIMGGWMSACSQTRTPRSGLHRSRHCVMLFSNGVLLTPLWICDGTVQLEHTLQPDYQLFFAE